MFAGPNGSGKTSLIRSLREEHFLPLGFNLNPDDVELTLKRSGRFAFSDWGLRTTEAELQSFCRAHPMGRDTSVDRLRVEADALLIAEPGSTGYLAAVLSDFLRQRWVAARQSFTYETVMSSGDKVDLLEHARSLGYRTYTYFVCTDRPDINVGRVAYRVSQGGHHVPVDKIVARYGRSLQHLPRAIASSDRAYLFDNSDVAHRLIAEYDAGTLIAAAKSLPAWFIASVLNARPLP